MNITRCTLFFLFLMIYCVDFFPQQRMDRGYYLGSINEEASFQMDIEFSEGQAFGIFISNKTGKLFDISGVIENTSMELDLLNENAELQAIVTLQASTETEFSGRYENISTGEYLPITLSKVADFYRVSKSDGTLQISAVYPQYTSNSVAALEYSEKIEEDIVSDLEAFWNQGKNYLKEDSSYVSSGWSRDINCSIAFFDESLSSIFYSIYEFTGGAHGIAYFATENVTFDGQEFEYFGLAEILSDDEDCAEELSELVVEELKNQNADWVLSGEISSFELSELHVFNLKPDGIEFAFAPYEVSAYARGPHFVFIPYSEIFDCLDMLSPVGIFFR